MVKCEKRDMKKIPKNIKLETKRLILRPVWFANPKDIAIKGNNFTIANFIGRLFPHPYKEENAVNFIKFSKENWNQKNQEWVFAIFKKENNEFIGCIGIKPSEEDNKIKNLGYWLGETYWGNGYIGEAIKAVCDLSFKELKVRKINAGAYSPNKASQKALIKAGFEIEGILKKNRVLQDGKIVDDILFGKLNKTKK